MRLQEQFKEEFAKTIKELSLKPSYDDFNSIFFLEDMVQKEGFVSTNLSRMVAMRITDTYMSWYNYLHTLIMPNPGSLLNMNESSFFDDNEKTEINTMMSRILELISRNSVAGISKDKKIEAEFLNDSVSFWNEEFKPYSLKIVKKINSSWKEKID